VAESAARALVEVIKSLRFIAVSFLREAQFRGITAGQTDTAVLKREIG